MNSDAKNERLNDLAWARQLAIAEATTGEKIDRREMDIKCMVTWEEALGDPEDEFKDDEIAVVADAAAAIEVALYAIFPSAAIHVGHDRADYATFGDHVVAGHLFAESEVYAQIEAVRSTILASTWFNDALEQARIMRDFRNRD